jgi:phosphoribosylformylglycinamidine synthase
MAGGIGAKLSMPDGGIPALFGEDQARYVLAVAEKRAASILAEAKAGKVPARVIGQTGGAHLVLPDGESVAVTTLRVAHESWFPGYMGGSAV